MRIVKEGAVPTHIGVKGLPPEYLVSLLKDFDTEERNESSIPGLSLLNLAG